MCLEVQASCLRRLLSLFVTSCIPLSPTLRQSKWDQGIWYHMLNVQRIILLLLKDAVSELGCVLSCPLQLETVSALVM